MPEVTVTFTAEELAAVVASVLATVSCSQAAVTGDPADVAMHEQLHHLSHDMLAEAPTVIEKIRSAYDEAVPTTPEQEAAARDRWATLRGSARKAAGLPEIGTIDPSLN